MKKEQYRINGFEQMKNFFAWVLENQDKDINPSHISLYNFLLNQNNLFGWAEWFRLPYEQGLAGSRIGSRNTYYKCLEDLLSWKLIDYKKGINYYKAPLVKIYLLKFKQVTEQVSEQVTEQVTEHIYITNNYKHITDNNNKINLDFVERDFLKIWEKWIDYRKRIKKPFKTQNGIEKKYNELKELSGGRPELAEKIIQQSIDNEWQGLFPLKSKGKPDRLTEKQRDYSKDKQF